MYRAVLNLNYYFEVLNLVGSEYLHIHVPVRNTLRPNIESGQIGGAIAPCLAGSGPKPARY
eukprot:SAG31_NODE_14318_length_814_cov_1.219580_1_plen_60_part_10